MNICQITTGNCEGPHTLFGIKNKILLRGQEIANDMGIWVFAASGSDWFSGVAWMTTLVRGSQLRVERWSFQWLNKLGRWVLVPIQPPSSKASQTSLSSKHLTWWLPAPWRQRQTLVSFWHSDSRIKATPTTQPLKGRCGAALLLEDILG